MWNYIMALYDRFSGTPQVDETAETLRRQLSEQLGEEQQRLLLHLVDQMDHFRERTAIDSFAAGFRLAAGIAGELADGWYSFPEDEASRAGK